MTTPGPAQSSQHPYPVRWIADGVSKGIAVGPVFVLATAQTADFSRTHEGSEVELGRFRRALETVKNSIRRLIEKSRIEVGAEEAEIFEAHLMMIEDEELIKPIRDAITSGAVIPEVAVREQFRLPIGIFEAADSDYLRERALDLRDLERQLLSALTSGSATPPTLSTPSIVVAEDITPSQTLLLDRTNLLGIITERGGPTSHTAIIARTLGIPAISGIAGAVRMFKSGTELAIDGREGSIFEVESPAARSYFEARAFEFLNEVHGLQSYKGKPSVTHDQHAVLLMGNIGAIADAQDAFSHDAEGVGLFRTEFLFMGRKSAPSLGDQRATYREALSIMAPREVVIRTLDIGGDKAVSYLHIDKEENPFLGVRALRYCFRDLPLFKTQIKAMLLANEWGNLSILLPMVSRASEAIRAREIIDECHAELLADPSYAKKPFRVGAMLEIPSLIFELPELVPALSFVSVGTNDLMQYAFAVDRMNPAVRDLYTPYAPGFLRMMDFLARAAQDAGLETGICGELGGQEDLLPLWVAMGFKKLSMTPNEILSKRRALSRLTLTRCEGIRREVLAAKTGDEVKLLLEGFLK